MFFFQLNKKKLATSVIIAGVALVGDKNSEDQSNRLVAAICDNFTHALIGAFTWLGMFASGTSHPNLLFFFEIALCGLFSSIIDLDHFVAAKSIHLKDAVSLKSRPPMHCTTLVALIVISLLCASIWLKLHWLYKFGWILAAAFFSHHIRDSKRRGFWLWPMGSTKPTPIPAYILAQMLLPHLFSIVMTQLAPTKFSEVPLATVHSV